VAVADARGTIRLTRSRPSVHDQPGQTVRSIRPLVAEALQAAKVPRSRVEGAGATVPGLVDHASGVCVLAPNLGWRDFALRDALTAADTVLAIWREPLAELAESEVSVDRSVRLQVRLPAHRLMPVALVAPEKRLMVAPVCGARTLAEGRPPLGIACAQQDVAHVYPLPDDPERCLEDFAERAAEHARGLAERIDRQEQSVRRFLELSGEDFPEAG